MLDGDALDKIVAKHQPDFIVPEIEAIRTERFMITRSKESGSFCKRQTSL
jgi:formate-dependent phosphoribosylglycinamide formyltransferase (GAR transformylase)